MEYFILKSSQCLNFVFWSVGSSQNHSENIIMGITISIPGVIFKLVPFKLFVSFQRNFSSLSVPDLSLWKFGHLTTFNQKNFSNLNKESYGNKYVSNFGMFLPKMLLTIFELTFTGKLRHVWKFYRQILR